SLFFFKTPAPPAIYTLSLHDALPISPPSSSMPWSIRGTKPASTRLVGGGAGSGGPERTIERRRRMREETEAGIDVSKDVLDVARSEEHTSELQSLAYLVCRLLLEKKK